MDELPDLGAPPFNFPESYRKAFELVKKEMRIFATTSVGHLFDAAAALLGFTRPMSFEGQAAVWLEHLARSAPAAAPYSFPELDFRPLLLEVLRDRSRGREITEIARAFHQGLARGITDTAARFSDSYGIDKLVLSGGVFQNELLMEGIKMLIEKNHRNICVWINRQVPPNDGGISLGQAALAGVLGVT